MADDCNAKGKVLIVCEDWQSCAQRVEKLLSSLLSSDSLRLCVLEDRYEEDRPYFCPDQGQEVRDFEVLLSDIRMLLLPRISNRLLMNLTKGLIRNPLEALIMEALCLDLPVLLLDSRQRDRTLHSPAAIVYRKGRSERLAQCGIKSVTMEEMLRLVSEANSETMRKQLDTEKVYAIHPQIDHVITEADILRLKKAGGSELFIEYGTCITPLAQDTAKASGIEIKRREKQLPNVN